MKNLGVLVPVATPCSTDGSPDLGGLADLCARMLEAGCDSIFVGGSTGRGPWFSRSARVRICRSAGDAARGWCRSHD